MMNEEYRIANKGSGKNIPVLRTLGYYAVSYSTNFTGALHLGFQTAGTAIKEPAAAPRNICRTADYSSERKVHRTETLNGNVEYKIRKSEVVPKASLREKTEDGRRNLELEILKEAV